MPITVENISDANAAEVMALWNEWTASQAPQCACWRWALDAERLAELRELMEWSVARDDCGAVVGLACWRSGHIHAVTPTSPEIYWRLGIDILTRMAAAGVWRAIAVIRAGSVEEDLCRRLGGVLSPHGRDAHTGQTVEYLVTLPVEATLSTLRSLLEG